mgnify:CR=1 FL=1
MPSLKDYRRRITSVKSTRQITRAMKLVAASKLRKAQERILEMRPYAYRIGDMIAELARDADPHDHPLLARREPKRTLVLVLTSDRGLAGAFNANINKHAAHWAEEHAAERDHIELHIVGKKGRDFFRSRALKIGHVHTNVLPDVDLGKAAGIGRMLVAAYIEGDYDEVILVYNEFKSAIAQLPRAERLLPMQPDDHDKVPDVIVTPSSDTLFEPTKAAVLDALLPLHVNIQIFRALLESVASEMGARMTAMEAASKNASELLGKLELQYNRARQAAITTELMEITAGSEAL